MIKTEKELLRLIWKNMGLGGHNADIKKRMIIAKEVYKAEDYLIEDLPPENREEMYDAIAKMFLARVEDIKGEAFTEAVYKNLLSSMIPAKKN